MIEPLPIDDALPGITDALRHGSAVVVQAPPGAGKSTRIPPSLLRAGIAGDGVIVMLEPRRVAARSLAASIAALMGETVGETVGYQVRFERMVGPRTRILVVTEGILTRRLLSDPLLDGVGCVILDEFHERSVNTDLALAFLQEVRGAREDLKLVVMSATMDARKVSAYLNDCPVITAEDRSHPLEITYRPDDTGKPLARRVTAAVRRLAAEGEGDILAFLPGRGEIHAAADLLREHPPAGDMAVRTLYGAAPRKEQDLAVSREDRRRVILATNIAQTSLTIPGVSAVVDTGLARRLRWDGRTGLDRLELAPISRADADQRAGRAGRLGPGHAVRLWSQAEHRTRAAEETPEILRVDPAPTLLTVLAFSPGAPTRFDFFEPLRPSSLEAGLELLDRLGALHPSRTRLSELGARLARLPLHPRLGVILLRAPRGSREKAAVLAALLSEPDPLSRDLFADGEFPFAVECDLEYRLDLLGEWRAKGGRGAAGRSWLRADRARDVLRAAERILRTVNGRDAKVPTASTNAAPSCASLALAGFPDRVCARDPNDPALGTMVGGRGVRVSRRSGVRSGELFLALSAALGKGNRDLVEIAAGLDIEDLRRAFPAAVGEVTGPVFNPRTERVVGVTNTVFRDLVLRERSGGAVADEERAAVLAERAKERFDSVFRPDKAAESLIHRLRFAAMVLAEHPWPKVREPDLIAMLPEVALGLSSFEELRKVDWRGVILGRMDFSLSRTLDAKVPEILTVPSGSKIRLDYSSCDNGEPPVLAVRLQELFGLMDTPRIAGGRIPVTLHLLAPNYRPVQTTTDLAGFWSGTYHDVRKDLRGRYPKHSWPEDPTSAPPTNRAKGRRGLR